MNKFTFLGRSLTTMLAVSILGAVGVAQRTEHFQLAPPDPAGTVHHGWAGAIDGDWAAVADYGATTSAGVATGTCVMYRRSEQGWIKWQAIVPANGVFLNSFGSDIALHGDELVIGARAGGIDHAGRVIVYRLINEQWEIVQELRAFDGQFGFAYGNSVAFDDETLVVGSVGYLDETFVTGGRGSAYVYVRSSAGWVLSERIPLPDPAATPHHFWGAFAYSCAVDGDVIVLGARGTGAHGMAFAYRRSASGWIRETDLYLPQFGPMAELLFGADVAISNGVIAVGAPVSGTPLIWRPSMVAFFEFQPALQTWALQQTVRASDWALAPNGLDQFGHSLALRGDLLVVGAKVGGYSAPYAGTGYIFEKINGVWTETERLVPSDPSLTSGNPAYFASSVAFDSENGRILVGSPNAAGQGYVVHPGKAYFYDLSQGSIVCAGTANVTLKPTRLTVTGSRRVSEANLSLSVYDAPRDFMGLYLVGPGGPPIPFGANGSLCVGQPFSRLTGVTRIGREGSSMHQIDFTSPSAAGLISPGATLTFQFIHRDRIAGTTQSTINASDAVQVLFE